MEIPKGLCQCGCNQPTSISDRTWRRKGMVRGEPKTFLPGHNQRNSSMESNHNWKGGKRLCGGYVLVKAPDYHRANSDGYVPEHILIAEKALGKPLPPGAQVHHPNGKKADNSRGNHVICQDDAYHKLLHQRSDAYKACGHVSWRKCRICKTYDDPKNLYVRGCQAYHVRCQREYQRKLRAKSKVKEA